MVLTVKEKAIALLARRDHSRQELKRKLQIKQYQLTDIEVTLNQLSEKNYLNDLRFTESYVRYRKEAGLGPLKITSELMQKGVGEELIQTVFSAYASSDWRDHMCSVFKKKFTRIGKTRSEKEKQARFLSGRGFLFEDIRALLLAED